MTASSVHLRANLRHAASDFFPARLCLYNFLYAVYGPHMSSGISSRRRTGAIKKLSAFCDSAAALTPN